MALCQREDTRHLRLVIHPHNEFRNQLVQAGVGSIGKGAQRIGDQTGVRHDLLEFPQKISVQIRVHCV